MFFYFHSSSVKSELLILQNFFPETSLPFLCPLYFSALLTVTWGFSNWTTCLTQFPSCLPQQLLKWFLQMVFLFFSSFLWGSIGESGYFYYLNVPVAIIYLSSYLFGELSLTAPYYWLFWILFYTLLLTQNAVFWYLD